MENNAERLRSACEKRLEWSALSDKIDPCYDPWREMLMRLLRSVLITNWTHEVGPVCDSCWFLQRDVVMCLEALLRSSRLINWVVISYFFPAHPLRSTNNHCQAINTLNGNLAIRGINPVTFSARICPRWCTSSLPRDNGWAKKWQEFWKGKQCC